MKKHRVLNCLVALLLSITFGVDAGNAWWSEDKNIHYYLCILSSNYLKKIEVNDYDRLVLGSQSPDQLRQLGDVPKLLRGIAKLLLHGDTEGRARRNFEGAVAAAERGDTSALATAMASAFHYVQDRCDPTKEGLKEKDYFRETAYTLLYSDDTRESNLRTRYASAWNPAFTAANKDIVGRLSSLDQLMARLQAVRNDANKELRELEGLLEGKLSAVDRLLVQHKVKLVLIKCFATIAAAQNRLVELLMVEESLNPATQVRLQLNPVAIQQRLTSFVERKENESFDTSPLVLTLTPDPGKADVGRAEVSPEQLQHLYRWTMSNGNWFETKTLMRIQPGRFQDLVPGQSGRVSGPMQVEIYRRNYSNQAWQLWSKEPNARWNGLRTWNTSEWKLFLMGEWVNEWVGK